VRIVSAPPRPLADFAIAAALFALAMLVAVLYCRAFERSKSPPEPWVKELGAAVAFACGHGYVDPGYEPSPAVAAFLEKKLDHISCRDLPAGTEMRPPNFTQVLYRYMTMSVGLTWRLLGVSWTNVALLLGLLYAASAAAVYGVFRLAVGRVLAVAGALIMTASPLELRFLPQLRDYAKTPFILMLILILGLLVVLPFSRRRILVLAAAYGVVMGLGFGFRNDLLINVLPFIVTVALFLPAPIRSHARLKLAALALGAASFVMCAWPIITAYKSGSNTTHVALLGLMASFDAPLGVTGSVYDWGAPYDDGFVMKMVGSYAERVHHRPVVVLSSEYERTAAEYLLFIARHWPADLVIRGCASILRVLELPFQVRSYTTAAPPAVIDGSIRSLYAVWDTGLSRLSGIGVPITALAVVAASGSSVRLATWLLAALLYFAGYPAAQFDARHFFFLEFIPWLALALVCQATWRLLLALRQKGAGELFAAALAVRGRRMLAFAIASVFALGGTVVALRAYQQRHVTALLTGYLELPTENLTLSRTEAGDRQVLLRPDQLSQSTGPGIGAEYLAVDVMRRNCDRLLAPVTFRYATKSGYTDLSQRFYVPVPQADAPFRLFFPVYSSPGASFAGLELMATDLGCFTAVRRVRDLGRTPLLLNLSLPPDWRQMKLYQTLTNWEAPSAPYRVRIYTWPRTLDPARLELARGTAPRLAALSHSSIVWRDDAAGRWIVRGLVRDSTSFLVRLPDRSVAKGVCFFARGTLYRGGFTLGVLKNQLWASSVNVTAPGEFLAVVEVPENGVYVPALANFLMGVNRMNDFVITAAGWADPDHGTFVHVVNGRSE
jgi:hypothetical protein